VSDPDRELRGLATWISRQSKNSLESSLPELATAGIHLDLLHFTADPRHRRRIPIAVGKYLRLILRLATGRFDFVLVNPADAWLRRPLALQGLLLVARLRRVAVVARWGNPDWIYRHKTSQQLSPKQFQRICRAIASAAVANLVLTATQGREVRGWVGFEDFDVIGNCMRVPETWLSAPRTPPPTGLVVNVASVQPLKGPDLFVKVAHEVVSTSHPDAKFVWLGGIATPDIARLIDELGVADSVEFRRRAFPPYPFLLEGTVMLFPSRSEAFGLAVAEAMACGLPVCCFEGTGPAEVIGPCGRAVDMASVEQAADAVRHYLDRTDHDAISRASRAWFVSQFSPQPFAEGLAQVLRSRIAPRAKGA
jgi:glycosyltransferase involved in cell wall biosynthesis